MSVTSGGSLFKYGLVRRKAATTNISGGLIRRGAGDAHRVSLLGYFRIDTTNVKLNTVVAHCFTRLTM
jgi:hypothetical protein